MRILLLLIPALLYGQAKFNQIRVITNPAGTTPGVIEFDTSRADNKSVSVQAPATATASYSLTLPIAAPSTSGHCLTGTTVGVLSWASCGSAGGTDFYAPDYDFTQTVATSAGNTSATLTPCPRGLNGADAAHWVRFTGTTPETRLITGGTCTSGAASGTITFAALTYANTGITSATGGIQEAVVLASAAGGGTVFLAGGNTFIYAVITLPGSPAVSIAGKGMRVSNVVVDTSYTSGDVFYLPGASFTGLFGFRDFQIGCYSTHTSGSAIHAKDTNSGELLVQNVRVADCHSGILLDDIDYSVIRSFYFEQDANLTSQFGIKMSAKTPVVSPSGGVSSTSIEHAFIVSPHTSASTNLDYGIWITAADGVTMSDVHLRADIGLLIDPQAGENIGTVIIGNSVIDNCRTQAIRVASTATPNYYGNILIHDNHIIAAYLGDPGIYYDGTYFAGMMSIKDNIIAGFRGDGISAVNAKYLTISGNVIADNDVDSIGGVGVRVVNGDQVTITGNQMVDLSGGAAMDYGVSLGGTIDNLVLTGNMSDGLTNTFLNNVATITNSIIRDNIGQDEQSATVAAGSTVTIPASKPGRIILSGASTTINTIAGAVAAGDEVWFGAVNSQTIGSGGNIATPMLLPSGVYVRGRYDGSAWVLQPAFSPDVIWTWRAAQYHTARVSIGTTTPATESTNAPLTVVGAAAQTASTLAESNSNSGFTVRGNSSSGYQLAIGAMATTDFPYIQGVNYNGGLASASLILQGYGGNVGIGVASPARTLDISGTLGATGAATIGSHILTTSASASDIGDATNYFQTIYAENGDFTNGSVANQYLKTRKLEIADIAGSAGFWDHRSQGSFVSNSSYTIRDNGGSRWLAASRAVSGSPTNSTTVFTDWVPALRATGSGDAVSDSTLPALGATGSRWSTVFGNLLDVTASLAIVPSGSVALGASGNDWNRLWVGGVEATSFVRPQTDNGGTSGTSVRRWSTTYTNNLKADGTVNLGTSSTVGYVWKATDTAGTGGWAADGSGQWTTSGSDIYYTTGKVGIGTTAPRTTLSVLQSGTANTTADTLGPAVFTGPTAGGYAAMLVVESNDAMAANRGGSIGFYGRNDASTNSSYFASIHGLKENGTSGNQAGYLAFKVRTAGNANPEVVRITSTENVGIGTASPAYKLDVSGTLNATGAATLGAGLAVTGNLSFTGTLNTAISTTELGYLDGVTSAIQTQLAARALTSTTISTTSPLTGGGDLSTNRTFACATCFTTAGGTMTGNLVVNTNLSVGGDIFPSSDLGADLGSAVLRFGGIFHSGGDNYGSHRTRSGANLTIQSGGAVYFDSGSSVDFSGTVTTGGSGTYSGTTSCGSGQAVKTITVSRGLVTAVTCATP